MSAGRALTDFVEIEGDVPGQGALEADLEVSGPSSLQDVVAAAVALREMVRYRRGRGERVGGEDGRGGWAGRVGRGGWADHPPCRP